MSRRRRRRGGGGSARERAELLRLVAAVDAATRDADHAQGVAEWYAAEVEKYKQECVALHRERSQLYGEIAHLMNERRVAERRTLPGAF